MAVSNDQIRNSIKRKISDCITYEGSRKTGGYYIRDIVEDAKYEDE
ncbi:MAG: hypothetical protein HUJ57_00550 [Erysipelotrichaceae bacterium]|nr:hypothetical protein [Erysipelotrichaceae bacterium]